MNNLKEPIAISKRVKGKRKINKSDKNISSQQETDAESITNEASEFQKELGKKISENQKDYSNEGIVLSIQGLKVIISFFSFAALVYTFMNSISNGNIPMGIPLTMFVYSMGIFAEYLEKIIKKEFLFGKFSAGINIFNLIVSSVFVFLNMLIVLINQENKFTLIVVIVNLAYALYNLIINAIIIGEKCYAYQKY